MKTTLQKPLVTVESWTTFEWKFVTNTIMSSKLPFRILIKMSGGKANYASMTRIQLLNAISIDLFYNQFSELLIATADLK